MATITEDYVSFETAKLLKEKGFDEACFAFYYVMPHKTVIAYDTNLPKNSDLSLIYANKEFGSLPTHQMAMKWLREVHKILILVEYDCPAFSSDIYKMDDIDEYGSAKHIPPTFANCKNYEQACEAAIKYCLDNLI